MKDENGAEGGIAVEQKHTTKVVLGLFKQLYLFCLFKTLTCDLVFPRV